MLLTIYRSTILDLSVPQTLVLFADPSDDATTAFFESVRLFDISVV